VSIDEPPVERMWEAALPDGTGHVIEHDAGLFLDLTKGRGAQVLAVLYAAARRVLNEDVVVGITR
jgi:hypothetical protein